MEQSSGAVNPQASRDELIRLAAMWDAEGSFCLSITNRANSKERVTVADLGMTDERTILWISDVLKKHGVSHLRVVWPSAKQNASSKGAAYSRGAMFRCRVQSLRSMAKLLEVMLPFLMTKAEEAAIVQEYVVFALAHIKEFGKGASQERARERHDKFLECRDRLSAVRSARLRDYTRYSCVSVKAT